MNAVAAPFNGAEQNERMKEGCRNQHHKDSVKIPCRQSLTMSVVRNENRPPDWAMDSATDDNMCIF